MKWVVLTLLIIFLGKMVFAQSSKSQNSSVEKKVNEHLTNTHKKIEIERQQREVELMRQNKDVQVDPLAKPKKRKSFVETSPAEDLSNKKDSEVLDDHYNQQVVGSDPSYQVQRDVQAQQEQQKRQEIEQRQFIEEFKRRARESGIEVDVDPKTLKATPK